MPVFNETRTIEEILLQVQSVDLDKEIVIVDDGSTDGTRAFLTMVEECAKQTPATMKLPRKGCDLRVDNIRVFRQEKNRGKGAALRRGFQEAKGDIVVIQDADLEYDPGDYPKLVALIETEGADVVYGSRFLGDTHRVLLFWHYIRNKVLTLLSNMVTDLNLSDVWTCYKAFRREIIQSLDLHENRFGFEQEVTIKIARGGWQVYETAISYSGRTHGAGKKITWMDGVRALWCILRYGVFSSNSKPSRAKDAVQVMNCGGKHG
jgi:glycosyltransferase involved in cell wall biosynthesis